ncbi:MAG TPA: hypothetical protein VHK91_17225 [Flavisolibacter sp.]|jgi:Spy/CpxP family protein refolding chaperone|nr:hypothetical protein [Flavisolibacter sp.]
MKKLFVLVALIASVCATKVNAQQGGGDPAAMMQRMKERVKPQLIEKTKLTDAQADKVIEINFDMQRQRREIRMDQSMSDEDKSKKTAELDAERDKKYKAIPLTDDQIKSVNEFFDEMRKQMQQRQQGGGGGN